MDLCLIAASFWLEPDSWLAIFKAAFGLGLVIFVHELGHFLVAKACGVKCEKFYVGFDVPIKIGPIALPKSLFKKRWGETEYGVGIIPLGGYVKMLGQDDNPANASREAERIRRQRDQAESQTASGDSATTAHDDEVAPQEDELELDPRSYPAKTVPQRMAIISAGVVMNLIFAVAFAAIAYRMGVRYTPCVVGATMAGEPAWQAGLVPGDKIIQLGKDGRRDEKLRFRDMQVKVVSTGAGNELDLLVRRQNGTEEWLTLRPNTKLSAHVPTIGVTNARTTKVYSDVPTEAHTPAAAAEPAFTGGDTIVAVNVDGTRVEIQNAFEIEAVLARHPSQQLEFIVRRQGDDKTAKPNELTIPVAPRRVRHLGLTMTMGRITAIAVGSPAFKSGFAEDDIIQTLNGQPVSDPMRLNDQLLELAEQEVVFAVERKGQMIEVPVVPRAPRGQTPGVGVFAIESLGLAYRVQNFVKDVQPGSPVDVGGIVPGDEIERVEFVVSVEDGSSEPGGPDSKPIDLNDDVGWPVVHDALQTLDPNGQVKLTYRRGDEVKSAIVNVDEAENWFYPNRGLILAPASEKRHATALGEAMFLGVRETKESVGQVIIVLRNIKRVYKNLGGPGTIAYVATKEASEGIPRLLVFLTLLSANLAVINFLPIPVLDGGHMMFLIYEGVSGKPVNERLAFGLTLLGLSFILCLMLFVIGLDVYRFSGLSG